MPKGDAVDGWEPHPTQRHQNHGRRRGSLKYVHGPDITPEDYDDGMHARGCCITGHCAQSSHASCWQADDVPAPDHPLEACAEPHRLRCRCPCHERTADAEGVLFL